MKRTCLSLLFCLFTLCAMAQDSLLHFKVEAQGIYNSNGQVPFWFRSNQFGSIPLDGASTSFIGSAVKDYGPDRSKLFDWGAGFEGRSNLGNAAQATLIEAYAKVRLGMFQLKGGRSKEIMGIVGDSTLSSGSFSVSGNALGVPQVSLSIPEFYTIPVLGGLFAVKGNFAHGWLGTLQMDPTFRLKESKTYFHQSSFYGRVGRPDGRFKAYGGFNHQVYWGNYNNTHPGNTDLSTWNEFVKVALGLVHEGSKVGNHLGSLDLAFEYRFPTVTVKAYRQTIYDIGALSKLANIRDGLNGLIVTNNSINNQKGFTWKKFLVEVFYTKNQAGEVWSKKTKSGAENYYNNYQYVKGWTYHGQNLGNPFITSRVFARRDLQMNGQDYYVNNRLWLLNLGYEGSIEKISLLAKVSLSRNYGTYRTSGERYRSVDGILRSDPNFKFAPVNQVSLYLQVKKRFKNNFEGGVMLAADRGDLLYNSVGSVLSIAKSF